MSSKLSKGITLTSRERCIEKIVSFEIIYKIMINNELDTPIYQTDLNTDKVNEMIESYHNNPDYLIFKNKIVIGDIITGNKKYILDGQHRLNMACRLWLESKVNDNLIFCYYKLETENELHKLFIELNKDSLKNHQYISLPEFVQLKANQVKTELKLAYPFFAKTKKENNLLYALQEFIDILIERKFFEKNINFMEEIKNKNNKFYRLIGYRIYYDENNNNFYKDEHISINNNVIFTLKNNNFIDYLLYDTIPNHNFKSSKIIPTPEQRLTIWFNEYKDDFGICSYSNCSNSISVGVHGFKFGYIDNNDKTFNKDNIRPICIKCNKKGQLSKIDDSILV